MEWIKPKTDWSISYDVDGNYTGDYFNIVDYNRIKNNMAYLHMMASKLYSDFKILDQGEDKTYSDYLYADEINTLEENFQTINEKSINKNYGESPSYTTNGIIMDYIELNRLEGAMLDLYQNIKNAYYGRRMFTWNFGIRPTL